DRSGGMGWRSDGGQRDPLARMRRETGPFAPGAGAPTTQGSSPVGAPPPVRTACPARPNAPPHIAPATGAPTNPKRDAPPVGAPPPVRTEPALPTRADTYSHPPRVLLQPKTRRPPVGAPPPVRTEQAPTTRVSPHSHPTRVLLQ